MKKVYLIAVVCALLAGFATFLFATELSEKSSYLDAKKETVAVAIAEVPQNTTITTDNFATYFEMKEVITSYVIDGAVTSEQQALNTVTRQTLYPGEELVTAKLITSDSEDAPLSLTLPDGYVAYPINGAGTVAADGFIAVGDKVDVYVYSGNKTSVPLTDIEVLKVSTASANDTAETDGTKINEYSTLTLVVTEAQATQLMNIEKGGYSYKLVLKPRVSGSVTELKEGATNGTTEDANTSSDYEQVQ